MDSNTNNTASSVQPPAVAAPVSPPNSSPADVTTPSNPLPASPVLPQALQTTQNASITQQQKGKPMMWVIILLLLAFVCGLALAAWYFQTQVHKL